MQLNELFTEMAEALRTKEETTDKISAESFPQRIKDLKVLDTMDATATANDIVAGKIAYANGKRVIGTVIDNGKLEYTPSDEEQIIPAGKISGGVVKAIETEDLEVTPSDEEQKFNGLFKNVIVKAGPGGIDTSDATATAEDILKDKTAYVNGEKVVGTLEATSGDYNAKIGETITELSSTKQSQVLAIVKKINNLKINNSNASHAFSYCISLEEITSLDTSNVTNMLGMFELCKSLVTIPEINTSNVTQMGSMFSSCASLKSVPLINTSKVTNMGMMFANATSLETIPLFNLSSLRTAVGMFKNCKSLTDEGLNNILAMFSNATNFTGTKTLASIGLTSDQATRCQSLSNYQALLDAGWTTGY